MKNEKTIYVIEDSKIISEIIGYHMSEKFSCKALLFENADDAMKQLLLSPPELIILDYNFNYDSLNYSTGLDFLIELRKNNTVPVIVFSGQRDDQIAKEIIKQGANDYIAKQDDDFLDSLLVSAENNLKAN
jgi:DNA-binding response OmpR family regulator